MSDLISRCELFNRLATIPASPEANELKAQIYAVIQSMETEDIVRCKECKFREANKSIYRGAWYCSNHGDTVDLDDFCSYGEREGE